MDKLYAIKIRQSDGTYGAAIPVSVLAENVDWNSTLSLVDILGQVDTSESIQDQINSLKNTKATQASVNALDQKVDNAVEYITHNSEIADAREGVDGTEYSTLKERLDTEYDILQSQNASSLVMVNEDPEDTTKVNITTSENEIELALQSDVDELIDKVSSLRSQVLDRKFVLIGDSYGMRNTPNWVSLFQQVFGNNVIHADARSSHGFATGTLTFLAILTDAVSNLTEDERNSVTDIVVVGGWNDARWLKQGGSNTVLQNAIKTFCQYAAQNFPNAIVTVEYCGWQLATGIQDNVLRTHLMTARTIYDGTWEPNLRHGSSMFKVMINPFVYDSSGFHPNDSTGAYNLFYALLSDLTGSGQFYYLSMSIPTSSITMGSGISGSVSVRRFTQIDGFVRLDLTFQNISGLSNGKTLCTFDLSALPFSLWTSLGFFGHVLNGDPLYCILNTDGSLKVYGNSASFTSGMSFIIRETFPMIINE